MKVFSDLWDFIPKQCVSPGTITMIKGNICVKLKDSAIRLDNGEYVELPLVEIACLKSGHSIRLEQE